MKKITLLFALLITSIGFSQDLLLGFEAGESGGINGSPFGDMAAPTIETDAGTNGTQVLKIVANSGGQVWQGINLTLTENVDLTNTQTMTMDVYSDTPITFLVKVNGGVSGAPEAAAEVTHTGSGTWETLSYTFNTSLDGQAAAANGVYTSFVIHAYWTSGQTGFGGVSKDERTFFVDNIKGPKSTVTPPTSNPPSTAAPTPPTRNDWDVISLYSGAYTDVASNFDAGWCGANSIEEIMVDGNPTMAYKGNACQGIVLDAGVDASAFTHLHVDIYIEDGTDLTSSVFNLKFVNQPGGAALEINLNVSSSPALVAGTWLSVDVAVDLTSFDGFKEFGVTSNLNNKVWYDNLYAYRAATASVENNELLGFSMYPNPANNVLNISAKGTIQNADIYNVLGSKVRSYTVNKSSETLDVSNLSSGIYLVKYSVDGKVGTAKFVKQ